VCADRNTGEVAISQTFQQISGIWIDLDRFLFESADFRNEVQSSLTLFLLQLQGDATNRAFRNAPHEVGGVSCNLVPHPLRRKDGHIIDNALVGVKIQRQPRVVLFNDRAGGFFDSFGTNALWE
jgi:hypothetical protein